MEARSVIAIVRALEEARVKFLVVGGLAVAAHGYVRLTLDVDLVVGFEPENVHRAFAALREAGYQPYAPVTADQFADATRRQEWREEKNMRALMFWSDAHRRTRVDVFIYEPFDFGLEWAVHQRKEILPGLAAPVVGVPSLLSMKREASRPKDLEDIRMLEKAWPEHAL